MIWSWSWRSSWGLINLENFVLRKSHMDLELNWTCSCWEEPFKLITIYDHDGELGCQFCTILTNSINLSQWCFLCNMTFIRLMGVREEFVWMFLQYIKIAIDLDGVQVLWTLEIIAVFRDCDIYWVSSLDTVNPRYKDRICFQRCCHYNDFAVVKNP